MCRWAGPCRGEAFPEIPQSHDEEFPLANIGLDRGSIGVGHQNFLENNDDPDLQYLTHTIYDKFHAVTRDLKLAVSHSYPYEPAMAEAASIMGMNYKPYGSGDTWEKTNRDALEKLK